MNLIYTERPKTPETPAEEQLQDAVRDWRICKLSEVLPDVSRDDRIVNADFIRYLVLEGDKRSFVHEKGVHLDGAHILGELDFHGCEIKRPLFLTNCKFSSPLILRDARTCTIKLDGSEIAGIDAQRAKVTGSLYMHNCTVNGEVTLIDTDISGSLEFHGARIEASATDKPALYASRVKTGGSVFLHRGFRVKGEVSFRGAVIHGNMECTGGEFDHPNGSESALSCKGLLIDGNVLLDRGFSAKGGADFTGATVHGNFMCDGGRFEKGSRPGAVALLATRARIEGTVYLRKITGTCPQEENFDFVANGQTNFIDAKLGGSLECHGGHFLNGSGVALWCSRTNVAGSVFLHQGCICDGEAVFHGANIGGNLYASDAHFTISTRRTRILNAPGRRDRRRRDRYRANGATSAAVSSSRAPQPSIRSTSSTPASVAVSNATARS